MMLLYNNPVFIFILPLDCLTTWRWTGRNRKKSSSPTRNGSARSHHRYHLSESTESRQSWFSVSRWLTDWRCQTMSETSSPVARNLSTRWEYCVLTAWVTSSCRPSTAQWSSLKSCMRRALGGATRRRLIGNELTPSLNEVKGVGFARPICRHSKNSVLLLTRNCSIKYFETQATHFTFYYRRLPKHHDITHSGIELII